MLKLELTTTTSPIADGPLAYGVTTSPFGEALWGFTVAGLCHLSLHDAGVDPCAILRVRWPAYHYQARQAQAEALLDAALCSTASPIQAWVSGSAFQVQVWRALLQIRPGELVSYQQLAQRIGQPKAARAVGSAVGKNPIAWLIPCHRVIRQSGEYGQYHWGRARKAAMIAAEQK